MLAVVDSGGANINSVLFALKRIGVDAVLTKDANQIRRATHVLLPGVGTAERVMQELKASQLVDCIRELKQPVLGICLGMQLLFETSTEVSGDLQPVHGIGVLKGGVVKLKASAQLPIPHMGWNQVRVVGGRSKLLDEQSPAHFYFVHSYAATAGTDGGDVTGVADYGIQIPAVVERGNFLGAQFHPERSGAAGEDLLRRFAAL